MTDAAMTAPGSAPAQGGARFAPILFGVVVFLSASLVFLVEPMIAKLLLPSQGGSPMVWNTCMAFFQFALLVGYGYAHLLQRVKSIRTQALIHAGVLVAAALVLPLRISTALGDPGATPPALWLLGVLTLTLGPPFAALSATAPLAQAWYARVRAGHADASNPYVLYAASNLGSLIALVAYPVIVEPSLRLTTQTVSWSIGYGGFVLLMAAAAFFASRSKALPLAEATAAPVKVEKITWKDRLIWIGLAAAPSSLMLGVTTHITTDIASAPFLWVAPLALYLLTFIFAFSGKRIIPYELSLVFHAVLVAAMAATFDIPSSWLLMQLLLHMAAFFFTAMVCHQGLAIRRPHPSKLTEFYLLVSVGGVIGGAFNAFFAPIFFNGVWEYPLVMILACLARPWPPKGEKTKAWEDIVYGLIMGGLVVGFAVHFIAPHLSIKAQYDLYDVTSAKWVRLAFAMTAVAAFLLRDKLWFYVTLIALITVGSHTFGPKADVLAHERSFFGVLKVTRVTIPDIGPMNLLAHGTTLHGAQAQGNGFECHPTTYYAVSTPIGQVFSEQRAAKGPLSVGAIGMGTGTVAAYNTSADRLTFFEIDRKVFDMSNDEPYYFKFLNGCSKGKVRVKLGDARLTLRGEPKNAYDILLVDAFSSDAVPAHLLTVEAMKDYMSHIKDDGIIIMHLSNRHLDLMSAVAAVAKDAGAYALGQSYKRASGAEFMDSSEEAIIVAKTPDALARFREDPRWMEPDPNKAKAWTDDYTNLFGAMWSRLSREMAADFEEWKVRFGR